MGVSRYELSDLQWSRIEGLLPGRADTVGRTAVDNRVFVNGVLWVLRSGARWHDLPERYGKYKSVHKRFTRWAASGVWEKVFGDLVADRKNLYLMIDSTIVELISRRPQAAKRGRRQGSGALPRRSDDQDPLTDR
jgi:putative transposase